MTEHTSPLDYQGMSGALNEHVSDVFGIMVKQIVEKETAEDADWLIGEGCIMPGVKGVALRSMKEPGTAYDDPRFVSVPRPPSLSPVSVPRLRPSSSSAFFVTRLRHPSSSSVSVSIGFTNRP